MINTEVSESTLRAEVVKAVSSVPIYDIHTHLYDPAFGDLLLWGIDDLLVYHYLVAEAFRWQSIPYEDFWRLSKSAQADLIWQSLFIDHSPISEACRGVLTTLNLLGLDVKKRDLPALRQWFQGWKLEDYLDHCLSLAGVRTICMTNSPFDEQEVKTWSKGFPRDARFKAGLRIDPLLLSWDQAARQLHASGYEVSGELTAKTIEEIRRFLRDWTGRIDPQYLMVSLTPDFRFPDRTACAQIIEKAVLPHCQEFGLPFALMIGVRRNVNPGLRLAGDGVGLGDLSALQALCATYPKNKFLVTVLARENQHELCVLARKFRNLHIFGCWWFTNVPYIVNEMTQMRMQLLGLSVTPQHSDARVLDQLIYKWTHSRAVIGEALAQEYVKLARTGWSPTSAEIERDVRSLFGGSFEEFQKTSF